MAEHKNGTGVCEVEQFVNVHQQIDAFAQFLRDVADSGQFGKEIVTESVGHVTHLVANSITLDDMKVVEAIKAKRSHNF